MTYTDDQKRALESMEKWAKDGDSLVYTLDGAAGTGKTTITKQFIQSLNMPSSKIAVTAPTHKAKRVIQEATNYTANTIQKLLGLRPDVSMDNFDPNKPVFNPLAEETIGYYKIVLIDESSMLNAASFKMITEKAEKYGIKVLFLGDAYQLPPVNEVISKVFSSVKYKSTLNQVVRQDSTNPMFEVLQILRNDVKNGTQFGVAKMIDMGKSIYNDTGFSCLTNVKNGEGFGDALLKYYFSTEYEYNKDYVKFLSYTNKSVEQWSEGIRAKIVKEDAVNLLNIGETLMGYNTIIDKRHNSIIIENSEDYIVTGIMPNKSEYNIEGFSVTLENDRNYTRNVFIVDTNNANAVEMFTKIYNEKVAEAKANRRLWKLFYAFKERHLLLKNLYYQGRFICKKDLYYGYGLTVHKSQGSTYTNVGLNLQNLYTNYDIAERNRLIYVALSRASGMNLVLTK